MPTLIDIPGRGRVRFPDGVSDEEIKAALAREFPPTGKDIYEHAAANPKYIVEKMTEDDFKLYKQYKGEKNTDWLDTFAAAAGYAGEALAGAVGAAATSPAKSIQSIPASFVVGTTDLIDFGKSVFGDNNLENLKRGARWAIEREEAVKAAPSPEFVEGASFVTDPTMFIPGINVARAGSKFAAVGLKAASKGAHVVESLGQKVSALAHMPENLAARATLAVTDDAAMAQKAASLVSQGSLYGAGADIALGVSVPGLASVATPIVAGKVAGKAISTVGEAGAHLFDSWASGPQRLGAFERLAADTAAGAGARALGKVGAKFGADTAAELAGSAIKGSAEGALIGGVLGGLANGEEGFFQGLGAGTTLGAFGGVVGRGVMKLSGADHAAGVAANLANVVAGRGDGVYMRAFAERAKGVNEVAKMLDLTAHAESLGVRVVFHDNNSLPGDPALVGQKYAGATVKADSIKPATVYLNVDNIRDGVVPHEVFHAIATEGHLKQLRDTLLGERVGGEVIRPGVFSENDFKQFAEAYMQKLSVENRAVMQSQLVTALDKSAAPAARWDAQRAIVDEVGASYAQAWAKAQKADTFLAGRIPTIYSQLVSLVSDKVSNKLALGAQRSGFDFSKGVDAGFSDASGKRVRVPELDKMVKSMFVPGKAFEPAKTNISLGRNLSESMALVRAIGAEDLVVATKSGARLKTKDELKAENLRHHAVITSRLAAVPKDQQGGARIIADVADRSSGTARNEDVHIFSRENPASSAQIEAIVGSGIYNQAQINHIRRAFQSMSRGDVHEVGYLKATEGGKAGVFEHSMREMLPYSIEVNKANVLYFRSVDITKVRSRLDAAFARPEFKGVYGSKGEAWSALSGEYLRNLSEASSLPSAEVLGGGALGEKRRNFFYEVMGTVPRKDTVLANPAREGYVSSRKGGSVYESFRFERVTSMVPTAEAVPFSAGRSYQKSQINFLPDAETGAKGRGQASIEEQLAKLAAQESALLKQVMAAPRGHALDDLQDRRAEVSAQVRALKLQQARLKVPAYDEIRGIVTQGIGERGLGYLPDDISEFVLYRGEAEAPRIVSVGEVSSDSSRISNSFYPVVELVLDNGAKKLVQIRVSDHGQVSRNSPYDYSHDVRFSGNPKRAGKYVKKLQDAIADDLQSLIDVEWADQREVLQKANAPAETGARFLPSSLTARDINEIAAEVGGGDVKGGAKAFGAFMRSMRDKGITLRDVVKSYGITLSSIQRQELLAETIKRNWPDAPFKDGTKVRPEDAFAQLLGTLEGQRYLDAAERGVFDEQAADTVVQKFRSFGFHNKLKEQMKTAVEQFYPKAQAIIDAVNSMPADEFVDYVRNNFKGISYGKVGFWSGQLGRGDIPTFDSRQGKLVYGKEVPVTKRVLLEQRDRLTQLGIKVSDEFKEFAQTLLHHEVWDRLNDSDTEHGPIKEAMLRFLPSDTDYLAAVKSGDMKVVQGMVDEAAKKAGFAVKLFSGYPKGISKFDLSTRSEVEGIFLTNSRTIASQYAGTHPDEISGKTGYSTGRKGEIYEVYVKLENPVSDLVPNEWFSAISEKYDNNKSVDENVAKELKLKKYFGDDGDYVLSDGTVVGELEVLSDFERILNMQFNDQSGGGYLDSAIKGSSVMQAFAMMRDVGEIVKKNEGYDGIVFSDTEMGEVTTVVFSPSQIKSADPITRDSKGNVIPLSKRFNTTSEDIRYMPADENANYSKPPSEADAKEALYESKRPFWGIHRGIDEGSPVGVRIDIPAYTQNGIYVQTVHKPATPGNVGDRIGYDNAVRLSGPVRFFVKEGSDDIKSGALAIKENRAKKHPIATVEGNYTRDRSTPSDINSWTAVGMNPAKHSYFYDKLTGEPVTGGSESYSVGNTVFVKDPVYGSKGDYRYMPVASFDEPMSIGSTAVRNHPAGYRTTQREGGAVRLYGKNGALLGVHGTVDEANGAVVKAERLGQVRLEKVDPRTSEVPPAYQKSVAPEDRVIRKTDEADGVIRESSHLTESGAPAPDTKTSSIPTSGVPIKWADSARFIPVSERDAFSDMTPALLNDIERQTPTIAGIHIDRMRVGTYKGEDLQGGMFYPTIQENLGKRAVWAFNSPGVARAVARRAAANGGYVKLILMQEGNVIGNKTFTKIWFNELAENIGAGRLSERRALSELNRIRTLNKKETGHSTPWTSLAQAKSDIIEMPQIKRGASYFMKSLRTTKTEGTKVAYESLLAKKMSDAGFPDAKAIVDAIEEPAFKNVPKGASVAILKIDPIKSNTEIATAKSLGIPEHTSYKYVLQGEPVARLTHYNVVDDTFPDTKNKIWRQQAVDYPLRRAIATAKSAAGKIDYSKK